MAFLNKFNQLIIRVGAVKISLSFIFILAIIFSLTQTIDTSGKQHIDKAFNRALITFGMAKTLNGVISVAQGTEVAIQPAGIGINLTPGQILDPVNDLVERFSWVMLASTTSLGIQKIFLSITIWPTFNYVFVFILTLGLLLLFIKKTRYMNVRLFVLRVSLLLVVLRYVVPVAGLSNEYIYHLFLENEYIAAADKLDSATQQISQLNESEQFNQPDIKKKSVWESAKAFYNSTSEMLDINRQIEEYKQAAKESTRHIINLIVVFVFQTIIIPVTFIFIVYFLFRYIVKLEFNLIKPD